MSGFGQFYQQGGVFMHLITLLALAGTGILAVRAARLRGLVHRVKTAQPAAPRTEGGLIGALALASLMVGLLGTTFGFMELCAAVLTIPPPQQIQAVFRATPMALTTVAWSLMLSVPLVLGRAVVGAVETRLRALTPQS